MSALPQKADMCSAKSNVRYGPKADIQCKNSYGTIEVRGDERVRLPAFC
jgi:hypothetical protein